MDRTAQESVDEFLDKYKQLELATRNAYGLEIGDSPIYKLKSQHAFAKYADAIDYCREVRNFLQHTPKVHGSYAVVPSPEMTEFLDQLLDRMRNRPRTWDIAVRREHIVSCSPDDTVRDVVETMRARGFSYVPILKDGRVVGVFDKDSVFSWVAEHGDHELPSATIGQIAEYTKLEGRRSEVFTFHARDEYMDEAEETFDRYKKEGKRVSVAFITEHGTVEERILGLFTAWDLIASSSEGE